MSKKQHCPRCGVLKEARAKLCRQCYSNSQGADGDPLSEHERFWSLVEKGDACWLWKGTRDKLGYGRFGIKRSGRWFKVLAHKYSYDLLVNKIPSGAKLDLDHTCRNPSCVNPAHLERVTHQENLRRGKHGNGQSNKAFCPKGHPYNEQNTYVDKRGRRTCRICHKEAQQQSKVRQKWKEVFK